MLLYWLLAQKPWIATMSGTMKLHWPEENIGAIEVELTTKDISDIDAAFFAIQVQGARYLVHLQKRVGR